MGCRYVHLEAVVVGGLFAAVLALVLKHVGEVDALHVVHRVAALLIDFAAESAHEPGVLLDDVLEQEPAVRNIPSQSPHHAALKRTAIY